MSEIDDIFSKSSKGKPRLPDSRKANQTAQPQVKQNKGPSKRNHESVVAEPSSLPAQSTDQPKPSKKLKSIKTDDKPAIETVDFSASTFTARPNQKDREKDLDGFSDSRGKKSSEKRTDDGLRVFNNVELQIGAGKGDTPQCPFDSVQEQLNISKSKVTSVRIQHSQNEKKPRSATSK
ncbi:hypothetical protein HDU83_003335 [Entophlyctis luteolus]|nr:hypothetical protein HDU83_003335 [Entophlyctis luteolus]